MGNMETWSHVGQSHVAMLGRDRLERQDSLSTTEYSARSGGGMA